MKFLDEYRDYTAVQRMAQAIRRGATRPWTLMEVCGGQTHTIVKTGLQDLLPSIYQGNIQKGKSKKKSWYQYNFPGLRTVGGYLLARLGGF